MISGTSYPLSYKPKPLSAGGVKVIGVGRRYQTPDELIYEHAQARLGQVEKYKMTMKSVVRTEVVQIIAGQLLGPMLTMHPT